MKEVVRYSEFTGLNKEPQITLITTDFYSHAKRLYRTRRHGVKNVILVCLNPPSGCSTGGKESGIVALWTR
jgi:hypothetical protein